MSNESPNLDPHLAFEICHEAVYLPSGLVDMKGYGLREWSAPRGFGTIFPCAIVFKAKTKGWSLGKKEASLELRVASIPGPPLWFVEFEFAYETAADSYTGVATLPQGIPLSGVGDYDLILTVEDLPRVERRLLSRASPKKA